MIAPQVEGTNASRQEFDADAAHPHGSEAMSGISGTVLDSAGGQNPSRTGMPLAGDLKEHRLENWDERGADILPDPVGPLVFVHSSKGEILPSPSLQDEPRRDLSMEGVLIKGGDSFERPAVII